MKTVLDVLMEGRAKVMKGWCQGSSAQNDANEALQVYSPAATQWCIVGAVNSSSPDNMGTWLLALEVLRSVNHIDPIRGIVHWNDDPKTTKRDVLDAFDKAIASMKE